MPDDDAALEGESSELCVPAGVTVTSADLDGVMSALNEVAPEAELLTVAVFAVDCDAEKVASALGVTKELLEKVTIEELEERALVLGAADCDTADVADVVTDALFDN